MLIRQTSPYFLKPADKWLSVNPTKPTDPNYSVLNTLDNKCKDDKGKFQFKLVWPKRKAPNYNVWKQSTNPVTEKTKVQGYEAVDVNFKDQYWGGLQNGHVDTNAPNALLEGSVDHRKLLWTCCFTDHPPPLLFLLLSLTHTPQQPIGSTQWAPIKHIMALVASPVLPVESPKSKSNFTSGVQVSRRTSL